MPSRVCGATFKSAVVDCQSARSNSAIRSLSETYQQTDFQSPSCSFERSGGVLAIGGVFTPVLTTRSIYRALGLPLVPTSVS